MIKFGDTRKQPLIFMLIFGGVAFFQMFFVTMVSFNYHNQNKEEQIKISSTFGVTLYYFLGYFTKLFAGILELVLRKGFHQKLKQPSPLQFKGYAVYITIVLLEATTMSLKTFEIDSELYNWNNSYLLVLLSASQIFIISLLSKLILKDKIGKHKKAGLIIIAIGVLFSILFLY